ncbi:hypothetical protein GRX03_00725 [Halovenus sp. WSH3]|uniref:Uncharacterized protein n=1 Tax=Halovenus carboxidivorans TaxID=2692199 RepID=A0A6B0SX32_9EURY|nr:hypothetical protein [Halovenus carboxidivorans]MXR50134.1 hypothetical protein [Halovenus carboxidivorans]
MDRTIDRRTMLQLGGAATVAAIAGCSSGSDDGDSGGSGSTGYEQYLAVRNNQVSFAYADFQALQEFNTGDSGGGGSQGDLGLDEPMLAPVGGLLLIGFAAGFQLGALGLSGLIQTESGSELSSQGNQILLSNGALVVVGDMDTDEIDSQLTSESEGSFATQYEQTDESNGYTFYEPANSDSGMTTSSGVAAVSGTELLVAESRELVDAVISAVGGDGRAVDEFDEFRWLLDNGGDGLVALGGYGPDGFSGFGGQSGGSGGQNDGSGGQNDGSGGSSETELSFVQNSGGFVGSISFDGEQVTSVIAASSDGIAETDQGQIESEFQSDRTDVSVDFQGDNRLVAEATYSRDVLEGSSGSDA